MDYSQAIAANYCFDYDFITLTLLLEKKQRKSAHELYKTRQVEGVQMILIDRHLLDDDTKFKEYFRLSPYLFRKILDDITNDIEGVATNWIPNPISPHHKLCITLRYLATGETFRSLAFQYRAHHSTIGRIADNCLSSIINHFMTKAIQAPATTSFQQIIADFYSKWNYPNVCGAIDGKHVRIKCPPKAGSAYFNYKDFHSIVMLAIVAANYKYIAVDVGSYGRESDTGIFLKSEMGKLINSGNFEIPPPAALPSTDVVLPNVILGDEAFALNKSMMKPYPRAQSLHDETEAIYNYRHSRARRTTANGCGIMSAYFRIFHTQIHTSPEKIDKIILGSTILHNMMRDEKIPSPAESTFGNTDNVFLPSDNLIPIVNVIGRPKNEGTFIRDKFKEFFNGVGAVHWQRNMIR